MRSLRRSFALRAGVGFLLAALALTIVGYLATLTYFQAGDEIIRDAVIKLECPPLTAIMLVITRLGSTVVLTIFGIVLVIALATLKRSRDIGIFLLAMAGQAVLHLGFKAIFGIQRPEALLDYVIGDTPSFPSGHALASTTFYLLLSFFITRSFVSTKLKMAVWTSAGILIFSIGSSRVYFGVHHPSDVLAGFLAGAIWTFALIWVRR